MARRPYVPSGKAPAGAVPRLVAIGVGVGLLAGLVEGFVSQWLSLVLIFPLLVGFAAGGSAAGVVRTQRIRNPLVAVGVALAGALLGQAAVHFMEYRHVRSVIAENVENDPEGQRLAAQAGSTDAVVDAALAGEHGDWPFIGHLKLVAKNGITITSHGSSSGSSPTLTGLGVWALWAFDLLLALGVAAAIAREQSGAPFCENCDDWYSRDELLAVGAGGSAKVKELVARLDSGQLAEAMRDLGKTDGKTATTLQLKGCARCNVHEPVLEVRSLGKVGTNKQQEKIVYRSLVTALEAQALRAAAAPQRP